MTKVKDIINTIVITTFLIWRLRILLFSITNEFIILTIDTKGRPSKFLNNKRVDTKTVGVMYREPPKDT